MSTLIRVLSYPALAVAFWKFPEIWLLILLPLASFDAFSRARQEKVPRALLPAVLGMALVFRFQVPLIYPALVLCAGLGRVLKDKPRWIGFLILAVWLCPFIGPIAPLGCLIYMPFEGGCCRWAEFASYLGITLWSAPVVLLLRPRLTSLPVLWPATLALTVMITGRLMPENGPDWWLFSQVGILLTPP